MKISKILNHNAALVILDDGQEGVVIGRGIAFGKKVGDPINPVLIEKKFCLSSVQLNARFSELLPTMEWEELHMIERIVEQIRKNLNRRIHDSIYVSLSDHIHYALKNHARGITVPNSLLYEIQQFYPDEFQAGKRALKTIQEETGVCLPLDEAGYIALHIINAISENGFDAGKVKQSTLLIKEILDLVQGYFERPLPAESLAYYRFIHHLRYFAQRILSHAKFQNTKSDINMLKIIEKTCPQSYLCACNVKTFIKGRYDMNIGSEELLYLTIHIERALLNNNE